MEKKQKNFFEILIFHFLLYQEEINLGKMLFFGMKASFLEIKLFTIKLTLIGKMLKLSSFTYSVKKQKGRKLVGKEGVKRGKNPKGDECKICERFQETESEPDVNEVMTNKSEKLEHRRINSF